MQIVNPAVVVISSDDEDDGERILHHELESEHPVVVLISSDDEDDGERKSEEGLESMHSDDHESDKVEQNDVKKTIEGVSLVNFDGSDPVSQGSNDLQELSLFECKTYLRRHGIRVSGTKEECIQRIKEHERLKDGRAEVLYPRSSFSIDCTGDACKGDVVLFRQNIYNSQRDIIGSRTVAGRIANESYGGFLQQHTFSVEVLWSKRSKKLEPLSILLVKGRYLYKFGTYRQPWESESDRLKVLEEKHERGKAARLVRKLREKRCTSGDVKESGTKLHKNTTAHSLAKRFQVAKLKRANQLTYHHPQPNHSIHYNNGQRPNHALLHLHGLRGHCRDKYIPPYTRLTNENIKSIFPESSFSINCTGDARKGDIVLFKQHVYVKRNKVENKRIVAGKIRQVRQCESKEKLKFVIQVFWTQHSSVNLCPGSDLLVRSHEFYKFGTFRQPWRNEVKRSKLSEPTGKQNPKKNKGVKRQKASRKERSPSKHKSSKREGASASATPVTRAQKRKATKLQNKKLKKLKHLEPGLNPTNSNLNLSPNPNSNPNLSPNPIKISSSTSKKGSFPRHNPNPNTLQNSHLDTHRDPNLNPHQNTNVNCHYQQQSSSFPYVMPNPPPPVWVSPNQGSSGSGYGRSATPTRGHKRKAAPLQKKKQKKSKHQNSNPNTFQNPNPRKNPKRRSNRNPGKNPELCQNPNPNTLQNPMPNVPQNSNLNTPTNPNLDPHKNSHQQMSLLNQASSGYGRSAAPGQKRKAAQLQKKKLKRSKHLEPNRNPPVLIPSPSTNRPITNPNTPQNPNRHKTPKRRPNLNPCKDLEPCQSPNQNAFQNLISCIPQNLNTRADPNLNPHPNSYGHRQHASSSFSYDRYMPNLPPPSGYFSNHPPPRSNHNPCNDSKPLQNLNLNTHRDPNLIQHANSYVHGHHQQASSSFSYDRSMMPNPPRPSGYHVSNHPPAVVFGLNQGFSGYGGQWGHNQLVALGLIGFWYQQQTR